MFSGTNVPCAGKFGRGGGKLEHGRALVHLVEHGAVKAGRAGRDGVIDLAPIEPPAVAGIWFSAPPFRFFQEKPGQTTGQ